MFREHIQKVIDRLDGGIAGILMGFDGITVDSYARAGYGDALPDVQTLAMEFAHVIAQARRTVQSLDAGALQEVTLVLAALLDVDAHGEEVADVAEVRAHSREAPVEEADAPMVVEEVAGMGVAVDDGERRVPPQPLERTRVGPPLLGHRDVRQDRLGSRAPVQAT